MGITVWLSLIHILGVDESDEAVGIARKRGVIDGLRECGVDCIREVSGDYSYESGIGMARELLDQGPLDALICATDRLAFGPSSPVLRIQKIHC